MKTITMLPPQKRPDLIIEESDKCHRCLEEIRADERTLTEAFAKEYLNKHSEATAFELIDAMRCRRETGEALMNPAIRKELEK